MQGWGEWLLELFLFNPVNQQVACAALGNCQGLFSHSAYLWRANRMCSLNITRKGCAPFSLLEQDFAEFSPKSVNHPKKRGRCQWPLDLAVTSDLRGGASFWRGLIFGRFRIRAKAKKKKQTWLRATSGVQGRYGLARCRFLNSRDKFKPCILT
uniref:Secreted protein n=1 Tax=Ixodes ricinus TaxID=34613 RepID=A0A6B0UWB2_IXORI